MIKYLTSKQSKSLYWQNLQYIFKSGYENSTRDIPIVDIKIRQWIGIIQQQISNYFHLELNVSKLNSAMEYLGFRQSFQDNKGSAPLKVVIVVASTK